MVMYILLSIAKTLLELFCNSNCIHFCSHITSSSSSNLNIVEWLAVLNMIRFPDRDPTGFCNSEQDPDWTEFKKTNNRIRYGYPNCIDHCSI